MLINFVFLSYGINQIKPKEVKMKLKLVGLFIIFLFSSNSAFAQQCIECHKKTTPNIVSDWEISKHSSNGVDCSVCHGDQHTTSTDFSKALIPTPDLCHF